MSDDSAYGDWRLYRYDPSLAAAVVFIVCFVLSTGIHVFQMIRTRSWIAIPLIIGGVFECIGYVGRALSSQETPNWTTGPYIMQSLLILIAPAFFAASIYMLLGRVILAVNGFHLALIKQRWLTKIFVCGDVLSFLMQASGGGIMATADGKNLKLGETIIIVGLFVQLVMFGFFIIMALHFHINFTKYGAKSAFTVDQTVPWRKHMWTLYLASGIIVVRSVFRVVEYIQGNDGYLMRHEVYLYVFDACLMLLVMVVLSVVHMGEITIFLQQARAGQEDGHHPLTVRV